MLVKYFFELISFIHPPIHFMRKLTAGTILASLFILLIPSSTFALEGSGPRIFVTGTIQEIRITKKQAWDEKGGELTVKATNGQLVTIVLQDIVKIISEGRTSRKSLLPTDLRVGTIIRANGWRVDSKTITASLVIILNIELNPGYSANGVVQSVDASSITILGQDAVVRTYKVTNETEVNISYVLQGPVGLSLVGKQAIMTLNPDDTTMVRILRITGNQVNIPTPRPISTRS